MARRYGNIIAGILAVACHKEALNFNIDKSKWYDKQANRRASMNLRKKKGKSTGQKY